MGRAEAVRSAGVGVCGAEIGGKQRRRGEMRWQIGLAAGSRGAGQAAVSGAGRASPGGDQRHSSLRAGREAKKEKKRKEAGGEATFDDESKEGKPKV